MLSKEMSDSLCSSIELNVPSRNQELVELMSSAVRDLAEAEFMGERDDQNNPLPSRPLSKEEREEPTGKNVNCFITCFFLIPTVGWTCSRTIQC